eukprot:TRINITY_DN15613_c1_g1_i1.p1 TRINITY_DN15613_c1_g1~~TRINITY_DN15613_c1_g1_i1.p1  ORF type:complete len:159 (+),score=29.15 TRINITY_DN15613_c1_g1_i1:71-547(+)
MASACVCASANLATGFPATASAVGIRAGQQPRNGCAILKLHGRTQLLGTSASNFVAGSYPGFSRASSALRRQRRDGARTGVVCMAEEKKAEPSPGPAVWIGRVAMLAWVAAIATEVLTGKGVLANVGVTSPAPTLAVALAAVVGAATAFSVFSAASSD